VKFEKLLTEKKNNTSITVNERYKIQVLAATVIKLKDIK
jgi:plasmid maintenance system killer protein